MAEKNLQRNLEASETTDMAKTIKAPMVKSRFLNLTTIILGAALALAGCSKKTDSLEVGTFGYVYQNTLKTACIECHVPSGAAYASHGVLLDFSTQDTAYSTLLAKNVTGSSSTGTCSGIRIVSPSTPTSSYILGVLISSYHINNFAGVSGCTPYANHLSDQNLSSEEQTSLIQWIQGGALNN